MPHSRREDQKMAMNNRMMPGRMQQGAMTQGGKERPKINRDTVSRLLRYLNRYKLSFAMVLICILLSAIAGVAGSMFLQVLIDDYIEPLLLESAPVFSGLLKAVLTMAGIYLIGALATLIYNRVMVTIAQGILKTIRDDMFAHMQTLPIRYFDTHTHGDIMSRYTNDTDTLRQMIAQSIPQVFSSVITIVTVFFAMLATSVYLTVLILFTVSFMLLVTRKVAGKSSTYFIRQQSCFG